MVLLPRVVWFHLHFHFTRTELYYLLFNISPASIPNYIAITTANVALIRLFFTNIAINSKITPIVFFKSTHRGYLYAPSHKVPNYIIIFKIRNTVCVLLCNLFTYTMQLLFNWINSGAVCVNYKKNTVSHVNPFLKHNILTGW